MNKDGGSEDSLTGSGESGISIVGNRERSRKERIFPGGVIHPWSKVQETGDFVPVLFSKRAEERIRNHTMETPDTEVMGLLVGDIYVDEELEYVLVRDVVTSQLRSSAVSVVFDHDNLDTLANELDSLEYDYIIVGWYHSHPGYGCFMSETDINTQRTRFLSPHSSALVIDPVNREISVFRLAGKDLLEYAMVVYTDAYEDPFRVPVYGGADGTDEAGGEQEGWGE